MQSTSKPEWITPGTLPLDDSFLREKIYQILGHKYAYAPTAHNLSLNWVDYSALSARCSSGSSHCTVGSDGPLSVVNQLKLLCRLSSKAVQDLPALDDLDGGILLREKIYKITGNKYSYSPTPHKISFSCADCSALSAPCSTGSTHCTLGSRGPLSDLDQWEPHISYSRGIKDLLAMEEDVAQANSITPETAPALAPVTCTLGFASCFPYGHFLVSTNECQDMKNHWKPIFTIDSNMREMNELKVEQCSSLVLTHAVNLTSIHLCLALPDCTLSVLLTRLHGSFRATGKLHVRAGGQKLSSSIKACIHQLSGNSFTSSAPATNKSIPWINDGSQHALNYIASGSQGPGSSVVQLSCSYQVGSSSALILSRPVQLAISQLTLALQVCNFSGLFNKYPGNAVPVCQQLKAKALRQIMSSVTSLRDIRVIPSYRTRKALQLTSGTISFNVPAQLSVDNAGHRGTNKNSALPLDENVLPKNEYGLRSIYPSALHTSAKNKKAAPTGCFKWLWSSKKNTALPVDENDLPKNNISTNEHGLPSVYECVLLPSEHKKKKKATGCFSWLWRSKKNNSQFCGE